MQPDSQAVLEAALALADATLEALGARFDEAAGDYYYDTEGVKRWVLGDGGASGNCDECEENAEVGWIPEDDVYPNTDEPPQHPHCTCTEEYKEKRVRVYLGDDVGDDGATADRGDDGTDSDDDEPIFLIRKPKKKSAK